MRAFATTIGAFSILLSASVMAADNDWDDTNLSNPYSTDGAFMGKDWKTETTIYTLRTPDTTDVDGDDFRLSFFNLKNPESSTITLTNSFDGFVGINVGNEDGDALDFVIISDTNTVISGTSAEKALVNKRGGAKNALIVNASDNGRRDSLRIIEGTYKAKAASLGGNIKNLNTLSIEGASFNVSSRNSSGPGGVGLKLQEINAVTISNAVSEADIIRGGTNTGDLTNNKNNKSVIVTGGAGLVLDGTTNHNESIHIKSAWIEGGDAGKAKGGGKENTVKAVGGHALKISHVDDIVIDAGRFDGGDAGTIDINKNVAEYLIRAGDGALIEGEVDDILIRGGDFSGGNGGTMEVTFATNAIVQGGSGLSVNSSATDTNRTDTVRFDLPNLEEVELKKTGATTIIIDQFGTESGAAASFAGGNGGTASTTLRADAAGGSGMLIDNVVVPFNDANFSGGNGGTATGSDAIAHGGSAINASDSLLFWGWTDDSNGETNEHAATSISLYKGGNGGTATGQFADARGGHGATILNSEAAIEQGNFIGGAGGSATTTDGTALATGGSGFRAENSMVYVMGGDFEGGAGGTEAVNGSSSTAKNGAGLELINSDAEIFGGTFYGDRAIVSSANKKETNIINIYGGIFDGLELSGKGGHDITFSTYEYTLSTFNKLGGNFNLTSDNALVELLGPLTLQSTDKLSMFNGGSIRFGSLTTTDGSTIITDYSDQYGSGILYGNDLHFHSNMTWVVTSENSTALNFTNVLASATSSLEVGMDVDDVTLATTDWLFTNYLWEDGRDLMFATKVNSLADMFDAQGEFGKAVSDLDALMDVYMARALDYFPSATEAEMAMHSVYAQTPEVVDTMMNMSRVATDLSMTRGADFRAGNKWSSSAAQGPVGAYGMKDIEDQYPMPDVIEATKNWADNHLPHPDVMENTKNWVDNLTPDVDIIESTKNWLDAVLPGEEVVDNTADTIDNVLPDVDLIEQAKALPDDDINPELPADALKTFELWGRVYGIHQDQDSDSGFDGYNSFIGGAAIGMDKSYDDLIFGLLGGFNQTTVSGGGDNNAEALGGYASLYTTVTPGDAFIDASVTYALNDVETETHKALGYEGDFLASTLGFYLGGGFGIVSRDNKNVLTPEVALLASYYMQEAYTEESDIFPDKEWDSYNQWSFQSSVGMTLARIQQIDLFELEYALRPELRVHWLHEFNADMDKANYSMVGSGNTIAVALQPRDEDLLKVGLGCRFAKWHAESLEFGLDVDGTFGKEYTAVIVSGKMTHRF